jgi:MarR family transcriptional regulator for hemolysin
MSSFKPDFMFYLHEVAHLLRLAVDKKARVYGMTRAQWLILLRLHRQPGMSQKELAELLEVEPITVARLIDRLEARGMVERRADPLDRRVWRLHLLPAAEPLVSKIEREREEISAMVRRNVSDADLALFTSVLATMKATLCGELRCARRSEGETEREEAALEEAAADVSKQTGDRKKELA